MTPQFLRSEAARFREMAEAVTDREASKQRLLAMAVDYDARATAAEAAQPPVQMREPEPQPASEEVIEALPSEKVPGRQRLRLSRTATLPTASGDPAA